MINENLSFFPLEMQLFALFRLSSPLTTPLLHESNLPQTFLNYYMIRYPHFAITKITYEDSCYFVDFFIFTFPFQRQIK